MQMSVLVGKSIVRETAEMLIVKDGERTDSYNRKYYRQAGEAGESVALVVTRKLPVQIVTGLHGVLAPL
ncbi:hypothetical protein J4772_11260 [Cohnella sp. LGH]|uniref:hypothetical protein n=1 Tax=Cohnella sp. LGH TaxID=1619153 RepID=UPI001ADBDBA8|nr:hypothetical protein [Cohnella sp. LGH]QTH44921.1 hypothetical protein J4772_11260 [Cohnella sp. LGH]